MQLVGHLDSPYVRRVAITARFLGVEIEHRKLSIFSEYEEFRALHPLVKVPTLICTDGTALVDSTLIIQYLETLAPAAVQLLPGDAKERRLCFKYAGEALVTFEKGASLIYETQLRPPEYQYAPWLQRLSEQLLSAVELLEATVLDRPAWVFGDAVSHADIAIAVAWRFVLLRGFIEAAAERFPALVAFSARAEALPEFTACPP